MSFGWQTSPTYRWKKGFAYLFLITDAYSRKVAGFHVSDDMKVSSAVVALKKALYKNQRFTANEANINRQGIVLPQKIYNNLSQFQLGVQMALDGLGK